MIVWLRVELGRVLRRRLLPRLQKVDVPNVTTPQKLDTVQGRAQVSTAQPAPDDKLAIPNAERPRKSLKESLLEMDCLNELMEENIFGRRSRPKSGRGAGVST